MKLGKNEHVDLAIVHMLVLSTHAFLWEWCPYHPSPLELVLFFTQTVDKGMAEQP
jgi:hypothetical protein